MKIDIATVATPRIHEYARYSIALNADYALRHGYGFHVFTRPNEARHPAWGKVQIARQLPPICDWLFVMDADAVFLQVDRGLEQFAKLDGDLLICENGPNGGRPLNTGVMMIRNTPAMPRFLDRWYQVGLHFLKT